MSTTKIIYGLYSDEDDMMHGIKELQDKGFQLKEVYTPFPVHGLDKLLKLPKTRISDIAFGYGVYGFFFAVTLTWFVMIRDWPQNIGGKPSFAWYKNMPAFFPIMFELTVFCTAHLMSLTFLFRSKLFPGAAAQNPDPRTTDDKFLVELESDKIEEIKDILIHTHVEEVTVKNKDSLTNKETKN